MAKKHSKNGYKHLNDITRQEGHDWYTHYYLYLTSLAYQLFEWEGLPESIDPRYLEMNLHMYGWVGFFKDPERSYIATHGAVSGRVDHYWLPQEFNAVSPTYQRKFKLYNYRDTLDEAKESGEYGIVIWNNDYHFSTLPSIDLFADELAETQQVIKVNRNAQKTPVTMIADDDNLHTIKQIYSQYEGNSPVIIMNKNIDPESIKVHKTDAPYVVDKLRADRDKIWNEIMTYLGIKNANTEKKERMITDEVESNNEQISASGNIWLKARQEACEKINELYDLNVSVKLRNDIVEEFQNNLSEPTPEKEGDDIG